MGQVDNLEGTFREITEFCRDYRQAGAQSTSTPLSQQGKSLLERFAQLLQSNLKLGKDFRVKASGGAGQFPYVPWVAILGPGQEVSNGIYVVVCFDSNGRGAVAGLARSMTVAPGVELSTVSRKPLSPGAPDVDSPSGHASQAFNDSFHNPREFETEGFSGGELLSHLQGSLGLYRKVLEGRARAPNSFVLRIGVDSDPKNPEVQAILGKTAEPFEVSDLYTFADQISPGDLVFVVLGGGKVPVDWDRGLAAIARVDGKIYDLGYRSTKNNLPYYRVKIRSIAFAPKPISFESLNFDRKYGPVLRGAPIVGANRVSQAIAGFSREQAKAAVGVLLTHHPEIYDQLRGEIPPDILPGERPIGQRAALDPDESEILQLLLEYGQVILYGPPGTGKTYKALRVASTLDSFRVTVFHPSYGYEDFIGGLRPHLREGGDSGGAAGTLSIEQHIGIFHDICASAADQEGQSVLVIDEINRGDIARIFGEVIYTLEADKRGLEVALPYVKGKTLTVPPNVFIIGTMNSSDRSIALIDVALRRRFAFHEIPPEPRLLAGHAVDGVDLGDLLTELNRRLLAVLDRDHLIGHAYFYHPRTGKPFDDVGSLRRAWEGRIIPLVEEYFYSNPARVRDVLGPRFVREEHISIQKSVGEHTSVYIPVRHETDELFLQALRSITAGEATTDAGPTGAPPLEAEEHETESQTPSPP